MGLPDRTEVLRKCSLTAEKGRNYVPFSHSAMEHFPKKFPQAGERLSRPNLGKLFSCVNVSRGSSAFALSNLRVRTGNGG
jgi:hypothetical protein